jgi:hypothetical protein
MVWGSSAPCPRGGMAAPWGPSGPVLVDLPRKHSATGNAEKHWVLHLPMGRAGRSEQRSYERADETGPQRHPLAILIALLVFADLTVASLRLKIALLLLGVTAFSVILVGSRVLSPNRPKQLHGTFSLGTVHGGLSARWC